MAQHMLTPPEVGWVDKRKSNAGGSVADSDSRVVGKIMFTANAAGTTTTILGADATLATGANVVRVGDKGKIFTSAGAVRDEKVVTITNMASATGTTTVTFSPAIASNTASGDTFRSVGSGSDPFVDNSSLDTRLSAIGYTQAVLDRMTQNDKVYAIRVNDDPSGF